LKGISEMLSEEEGNIGCIGTSEMRPEGRNGGGGTEGKWPVTPLLYETGTSLTTPSYDNKTPFLSTWATYFPVLLSV